MTEYTDRPVATVAAELGAVATLIKPFDLALLHEASQTCCPGTEKPDGVSGCQRDRSRRPRAAGVD